MLWCYAAPSLVTLALGDIHVEHLTKFCDFDTKETDLTNYEVTAEEQN